MGEKIRKTHSSDHYDIANYFEIGKELLFIALLGKGKDEVFAALHRPPLLVKDDFRIRAVIPIFTD